MQSSIWLVDYDSHQMAKVACFKYAPSSVLF